MSFPPDVVVSLLAPLPVKTLKPTPRPVTEFFPKDRVIPVFEVLSTLDKLSGFTGSLKHHQIKNVRKVPTFNVFFAGITGIGCNHGIGRISKISRHINLNELDEKSMGIYLVEGPRYLN